MRRDEHIFEIDFQIAGATEPDEYAIRGYEDDRLHDFALCGPGSGGVFEAHFGREAPRFEDAVLRAMDDLRGVFPEAQILEVKPNVLVTLADIAERTGRTHESVRLLARGKRGPGNFPRPAGGRRWRSKVWRWYEVAHWLETELGVEPGEHRHAAFLAAVNDVLELRRLAPRVAREPRDARRLADLLPAELAQRPSARQAVEDQVGAG